MFASGYLALTVTSSSERCICSVLATSIERRFRFSCHFCDSAYKILYSCVHLINACLYFWVTIFVAMAKKDHISVLNPTCKGLIGSVVFPNSESLDLFEEIWASIQKSGTRLYTSTHAACCVAWNVAWTCGAGSTTCVDLQHCIP